MKTSSKLKEGLNVRVLRQIKRLSESAPDSSYRMDALGIMQCSSPRMMVIYAEAGETGVVKEVFRPESTGGGERKAWYVKVMMDSDKKVKTFRQTSLEVVP